MRDLLIAGVFGLVVFVAALAVSLRWHEPPPQTAAYVITPDGVEMRLIQEGNWRPGERYTTSLVYRKPGANWRWFPYGTNKLTWGPASVALHAESKIAIFYRNDAPAITFNWDTEQYTVHWSGRSGSAPNHLPADWTPERPIADANES